MNPQIASNSSSSLLSTISSSSAVMTNPYVYSQTANVDSFCSTQWVKSVPTSGSLSSNSTLNFDIPKMGLVGRAILDIPFKVASSRDNDDVICPNYPLWAINEIVISSQGRTISRLDRSCIMARIGERPSYTKEGIVDNLRLKHTAETSSTNFPGAAGVAQHSYLSLDFAFNDNQYAIDTLFLQSIRISVTIGNLGVLTKTTATNAFNANLEYSSPAIYLQYKNQNQVDSDALTSANYSSGLLSQIIPTMVSETTQYVPFSAVGQPNELICELKETSCIENIYVMMMVHPEDSGTAATTSTPAAAGDPFTNETGQPLPISGNIVFSSNGQNWFDLPARLIGAFGLESQHGRNAYSNVPIQTVSGNTSPLAYVYVINMAQGGLVDNKLSGLLSMRELSNPRISCTANSTAYTAGKKVALHVCYNTRQLSTVVSSSGQYNISLSN